MSDTLKGHYNVSATAAIIQNSTLNVTNGTIYSTVNLL
jgi:hypothetical protein